MERILNPENEKTRKLQKSKSMEFLKAKLLSRKSSTKSQVQPVQQQQQHNHGPLDPRLFQHVHAPSSPSRQQMYVFLKLLPHDLQGAPLCSACTLVKLEYLVSVLAEFILKTELSRKIQHDFQET